MNTEEARAIAGTNEKSFFHITRPEIDLPDETNPYSQPVYEAGKKNLDSFISKGVMNQDKEACLYLYTQVMNGRSQTGLVACVNIDDYINDLIKKHELTREDKEQDRTTHLATLNANTGPVFLLYREDGTKDTLFEKALTIKPENDFTADDGIRHILRVIKDQDLVEAFKDAFQDDILYIADGHHRAASAVRVGQKRRLEMPSYNGKEEFNWFLSVIFPHNQLNILSYNRAVRDLNGLKADEFLNRIAADFSIKDNGVKIPESIHNFSLYLNQKWYTLIPDFPIPTDPVESLDVKILQTKVLDPILGIKDPRKDKRIDFIGGIRGTGELEKLVDSNGYATAFSLYPTTVEQLINVSDNGCIMPPKSTWFEPKLRSGLVVHLLT